MPVGLAGKIELALSEPAGLAEEIEHWLYLNQRVLQRRLNTGCICIIGLAGDIEHWLCLSDWVWLRRLNIKCIWPSGSGRRNWTLAVSEPVILSEYIKKVWAYKFSKFSIICNYANLSWPLGVPGHWRYYILPTKNRNVGHIVMDKILLLNQITSSNPLFGEFPTGVDFQIRLQEPGSLFSCCVLHKYFRLHPNPIEKSQSVLSFLTSWHSHSDWSPSLQ